MAYSYAKKLIHDVKEPLHKPDDELVLAQLRKIFFHHRAVYKSCTQSDERQEYEYRLLCLKKLIELAGASSVDYDAFNKYVVKSLNGNRKIPDDYLHNFVLVRAIQNVADDVRMANSIARDIRDRQI